MSYGVEIIAQPFDVWVAPVGTAFPKIDADPAGGWEKLGTNGTMDQDESGVVIDNPQKVTLHYVGGSAGPVKASRTQEEFNVTLKLVDLTLESYMHAINEAAITTVAATGTDAGYKKIGLSRGTVPAEIALLIRGVSPYGANFNMQFEIPRAINQGSPKVAFNKKDMATLELTFAALEDPSAATPAERFGRLIAMTASHS